MDPTQLLTLPSQAYREATEAQIYKISEGFFGSLLVAYLFGFFGFLITNRSSGQSSRLIAFLLITQYVSISLTFAVLTISFYLKFRTEILTMPQKPLDRPGIDVGLALAQGLTFGFSMYSPWSFPILLGIYLLLTGSRQNKEHRALAVELYTKICRAGGPDKSFRLGLKRHLRKDFSDLKGWGPTGGAVWSASIAMISIGLTGYLVTRDLSASVHQSWITFEAVLLMVTILVLGYRVLKRYATFLDPIKNGNNHINVSESPSYLSEDKPVSSQVAIKHDDAGRPPVVGSDRNDQPEVKKRPKIDVQFECLQKSSRNYAPIVRVSSILFLVLSIDSLGNAKS